MQIGFDINRSFITIQGNGWTEPDGRVAFYAITPEEYEGSSIYSIAFGGLANRINPKDYHDEDICNYLDSLKKSRELNVSQKNILVLNSRISMDSKESLLEIFPGDILELNPVLIYAFPKEFIFPILNQAILLYCNNFLKHSKEMDKIVGLIN